MTNNIDILISAKDQASATIKKVDAGISGMSANFKTMSIVGGVAFGALTGVLMKSVAGAQEAQKVHAQLGAVLKSTGNAFGFSATEIEAHASALQKTLGIADETIQTGQNMLLTFTNIGKDVFPQATETLLDMATAMNGGATPSAEQLSGQAIQLGKALNDPMKGITALTRVGVTFTDEQKKTIETMVALGDTAGAQKLILAELGKEFGGSALAQAQTFEGSMKKLKLSFDDIFENIGTAVLPALQKMTDAVTPILARIAEWASANPTLVTTILGVGLAVSGIVTVIGLVGLALPSIITGFSAVGAVLAVLTGPIGLVIAGVALLGTAWATNFLGIRDITASAWEWIKTTFQAGIDWIKTTVQPFLDEVSKFWSENGEQILTGLSIFWEGVKIVFTEIFDWIKLYLGTAWEVISGIFSVAFTVIQASFQIFFETITGILTVGMQIINGDWSGAWETVKNTFNAVGKTIISAGGTIFEKLHGVITGIVSRIEEYVASKLRAIKDTLLEIASLGQANTGTYNPVSGKRANGGMVQSGKTYLVGENGPEIFTANRSGNIIPNSQIGGGMSVNINFGDVSVKNEGDINTLASMIEEKLTRQMQLYKLGIS